jgi:hypothetical protein
VADLATLQARLTEAEDAYHQLAIGRKVVQSRTASGRFLVYTQADMPHLAAYVERLKGEIAALLGTRDARRPLYVRLGN